MGTNIPVKVLKETMTGNGNLIQGMAEESRFAYKDIDEVMANQSDLVIPVKRLRTVGVVKG